MIIHPRMSCLLSARFTWSTSGLGGKWTRQQQSLKMSTHLYNKAGQDFRDYPSAVLTTKLRIPGAGNVLQLRYEGEPGKPFKFIGVDTSFITRTEK